MKKFIIAACAASLAFVAAADVASAAKKARKSTRIARAATGTPFPGAQRSGDFGGASQEGTNEVETILGNNPMVKAPVRPAGPTVARIDAMPGNNPMSGTAASAAPAAKKKR